jgi:hypothetical protein
MSQLLLWVMVLSLILSVADARAGTPPMERLPVTKDVWVSAHPDELDTSMGKTTQLKLKGNTEVALLDFDGSGLRGKHAVRAELWMHDVLEAAEREKQRLRVDPARPDCLHKIGVSTIATPWEEGSQTESYQPDPVGATYRNAGPGRPWSYSGSQLWAVIFGNGNSLHCHAERQYQGDGWWKVEVDPRLVDQVIYGVSHGLVVEDESSPANGFMPNNYVHSRESGGFAPYLLVEVSPGVPAPLPRPAAESPVPEPPPLSVSLPAGPFHPAEGDPPANDSMLVWAFPEVTKVDPVSGEAMFEPQSDMRRANAVWDGADHRVRIAAARGEIAAFQLAIERKGEPLRNVRVEIDELRGERGTIPASAVRTYRMWYVPAGGRWQEEYAIPLSGGFDIPASDNAINGSQTQACATQRVQAVYVDVVVPPEAPEGRYGGTARVTAGGAAPLEVAVEVQVYPVTIPAEINFNAELNAYEPPGGEAGSDYFYAAHRLAHYHRCTINVLGYSQTGRITNGYAPAIAGGGAGVHTTEWRDFDRIMGPLLDGSAFRDNPRASVPVKTFYLPLSEHWPLSFWNYYPFQGDPRQEADMARHALEAPPVDGAFAAEYTAGWERVAREFGEHLSAKGWSRTDFQCYFNDKPTYGGTWWTLDEPMGRDDWLALRFWAGLFKEATRDLKLPNLRFRGDISRPWWQYHMLDGRMDTIYYNSEIFGLPEFARDFNRRIPDPHVYGAANDVAESDHQTAAWCLKAYALGLNGVLPWQSLGDAEALRKPDQTALIVPGDLAGHHGPVASLRVLALRRGAQDVELLRLLAQKRDWTAEQVGVLVASRVPLGSEFSQHFQDEAAALGFGDLSAEGFVEVKEGVLMMLR